MAFEVGRRQKRRVTFEMRLAILAIRVRIVLPRVYSHLHLVRDRDRLAAEQSRWVQRNVAGILVLSLLAVVTLTG